MPKKVYWDSCAFLGLLNEEPGKLTDCRAVWDEAEQGKTIIVTSLFTFTEVFKAKCEGKAKPLPPEDDKPIQDMLGQKFIQKVLLDEYIAVAARTLLRAHPECKKPSDAIHLATALRMNVEEMHTYDGSDLLILDGKTMRQDGQLLKICRAQPSPVPAPPPDPKEVLGQRFLFDGLQQQ